jgi:hypothetical protein
MTTADSAALKAVLPATVADLAKLMIAADMHEAQACRVSDDLMRRALGLMDEAQRILADGFQSAARLRRQVIETAGVMPDLFDERGLVDLGDWTVGRSDDGRTVFVKVLDPPLPILPLPKVSRCG